MEITKVSGKVFKYGDDVNTDVIIPARYMNTHDPKHLAAHCMEDIDKDFVTNMKPGDVIVAGKNFGCGSSREHAPISIKYAGVGCVIAKTFARIFYRNCINMGLPIMECPEAAEELQAGDEIEINFDEGTITNKINGKVYKAHPFPPFMKSLIEAGGLMNYAKKKLAEKNK
jgi:3-isopropylmalate/(R)-2-methylmalate dehydratase small subunit